MSKLSLDEEKIVVEESKGINAFVLIFFVIVLATVLTYIMPAGQYERVDLDGRTVVDPTTFQFVESSPVGFLELFNSVHSGMMAGSAIIFFVLMVGGAFGILKATGALDALVKYLSVRLANRENILIPILILVFAAGGTLMGMAEETIVYIGILVPLAIALGFDAITGFAIVSLGASIGFSAAIMNPFTVGVAQGIAELPTYSGMGLRVALLVVLFIAANWYIFRYAKKIKENPELGFYGHFNRDAKAEIDEGYKMERRHVLVLLTFLLNFIVLIYGVIQHGWYITEIAGLFLFFGILMGLIGRLSASRISDSFIAGARDLIAGALIIGFAQTILVIFQNGNLMDTILYYAAGLVGHLPPILNAVGMFLVQLCINFFIPSGSGQAALTMPIMAPLSDLIGVTRQTAVLAYQLGDGLSNIFFPTVGYFMAALAVAGIPWGRWIKWVLPFFILELVIAVIFLILAQIIQYGPF